MVNRFKGIDVADRVPEKTRDRVSSHCIGSIDQSHPKEKEMQESKVVAKEASQAADERRRAKSKGGRERYTHMNAEFQRIARRDKKAFLNE